MGDMSPLEKAILDLPKSGWVLAGLSKSPFDSPRPWTCDLIPGHLGGSYYWGNKAKSGLYSTYPMAQARVIGSGDTPLAAIKDALVNLANSDAAEIYDDLIRAFEDAVDARTRKA